MHLHIPHHATCLLLSLTHLGAFLQGFLRVQAQRLFRCKGGNAVRARNRVGL